MKNVKNYCRDFQRKPPKDLLNKYNSLQKRNLDYKLMYKELFPCFFTGNINKKNSYLTISLNPKLDNQTRKDQRGDFNAWFDFCLNRFENYETESAVHFIFKNLLKLFFTDQEIKRSCKRKLLQENLINIDWCPYYSKKFVTTGKLFFEKNGIIELYEIFNKNLNEFIKFTKPRCIFIHGKSFDELANEIMPNVITKIELNHGDRPYEERYGYYKKTKIPVFYQTHFINRANKNENLEEIRKFIATKIK